MTTMRKKIEPTFALKGIITSDVIKKYKEGYYETYIMNTESIVSHDDFMFSFSIKNGLYISAPILDRYRSSFEAFEFGL